MSFFVRKNKKDKKAESTPKPFAGTVIESAEGPGFVGGPVTREIADEFVRQGFDRNKPIGSKE